MPGATGAGSLTKFKVVAHTPGGAFQHVIRATDADAAWARAFRAHPTAVMIEVTDLDAVNGERE